MNENASSGREMPQKTTNSLFGDRNLQMERICADDVINAYKLILGRYPENGTVVLNHLKNCATIVDLRKVFLNSSEFKRLFTPPPPAKTLVFDSLLEAPRVDCDATSEQGQALIAAVEKVWEQAALSQPYHNVISTRGRYRGNDISPALKTEFYKSGQNSIALAQAALNRAGLPDFSGHGSFLEFGCGAGRNLIHFAKYFDLATGLDISPTYLELAGQAIANYEIQNINLALARSVADLDKLPTYDFIFTYIVLQHNPPPVIAMILAKLIDHLHPDGLMYFQVPTYINGYSFDLSEYLKNSGASRKVEMHMLPQAKIFQICGEANCQIMDVRANNATGSPDLFISESFLIQKKRT